MDIVDTFNHLIPTEHLDDALFLGSNLENEVCEDFSTSQNVLEDSLKNMLSDKDPMLGSASAQFCLPVLDSTDPNFQMPCSTVVGLDDIMDEGVKQNSPNTIDEDDLSPNRNLRDQMDGTSVKSPRKSPRLMTQEPVRSLRQSTLAKRSNASPPANTKKSAVRSGSAQKGGLKQQDKEQTKREDHNAQEHSGDVEHSNNEPCQEQEAVQVSSPPSSNAEWVSCCESTDKVKDSEHKVQAKKDEASIEVGDSSQLPGISSPVKETESECGSVGAGLEASAFMETDKIQNNNPVKNEGNETMVNNFTSEISSEEKPDNITKEELNEIKMLDESKEAGMADTPFVTTAYENASERQETSSVQSSFVDRKPECNSGLQSSGDIMHQISLPEDNEELLGDPKKAELKDSPLHSMELDKIDSKSTNITSAKSEANSLKDGIVQHIPVQAIHQEAHSVKMGAHEPPRLQEDGYTGILSKCVKNVKTKHSKSKQNKTTTAQQKLASLNQEVHSKTHLVPGVCSQSSGSLKRQTEEQGDLQHLQRPVKVKKKHPNKDMKAQNCESGKTFKKSAQVLGKNIPQVQISAQVRKMSSEKASDKSFSHHAGSKEASNVTSGPMHPKQGQLTQHNQKQLLKHQLIKTNNCIKEEGGKTDSTGVSLDNLKEDEKEKLKLRKLEKNLQPRQRRSSRSLSVDEPPLFIPDNISTIKRESSEHLSPNESKSFWVPSKQCGFCKKPHGNSCTSSNSALQHG